jgi:DNA-binding NarL/FixJ family response regulator
MRPTHAIRANREGQMTRILIADDHSVVLSGLRSILGAHAGWEVVAEATNGKEAIQRALQTKPDIAILDYSLPIMNGLEATRQIRVRVPSVEILIFTMHDSDTITAELLQAGARAYLLKSEADQYLVAAVESLAVHRPFFTGPLSERLLDSFVHTSSGRSSTNALSPRERSVVQLIAEGKSNKQMSDVLNISIKTVETHRATAMRKLGITSTAGVVRYAIRNQFIEA